MTEKTNFFNRHLRETGEGYFEHLLFAFSMSIWIGGTAFMIFVHSIFPFLFTFSGSRNVKRIHEVMQKRFAHITERREKMNAKKD